MSIKDCQCSLGVVADITQNESSDEFVQDHHQLCLGYDATTKFKPSLSIIHDTLHFQFELKELGDVLEGPVEGSGNSREVLDLDRGRDFKGFLLWVVGADACGVDTDLECGPFFLKKNVRNSVPGPGS